MTHDDTMRSLHLMGTEVLPAMRDMAKELDLPGPFDVDPATNKPYKAEFNGPMTGSAVAVPGR